jgi:hypothetical protein
VLSLTEPATAGLTVDAPPPVSAASVGTAATTATTTTATPAEPAPATRE